MDDSVYRRPNKPSRLVVRSRRGAPAKALPELAAPVEVDSFTECHVTPPDVAARMVEYLGRVGDFLTLEPSAGTGNLLAALFDSGHSVNETVAMERHHGLCRAIRQRFTGSGSIDPIQGCFLEYVQEYEGRAQYPRILMNPPFRQVRQHMTAALSLVPTKNSIHGTNVMNHQSALESDLLGCRAKFWSDSAQSGTFYTNLGQTSFWPNLGYFGPNQL